MKKKNIIITFMVVALMATVVGCGRDAGNVSEKSTESKVQGEKSVKEKMTTEEAGTEEQTTGSYSGDYSEYSKQIVEWGVGTNRLEDGRYEAPVASQSKYSDYKVDFIKENEKVIYVTFDEGYENGYSPKILDILKEKDVKAVFFVTMDFAKSEPKLIKRMIDEGHVLGNHSVSHPSMPSLSVEKQMQEYVGLHQYIYDNYQYSMYLFRPPMGHFSEQSLAIAGNLGYTSVLWSFAHCDWDPKNQPTKEKALQTAVERLHNGAIYLLHAVSEANTNMLGEFIDQARAEGYTFKEYSNPS